MSNFSINRRRFVKSLCALPLAGTATTSMAQERGIVNSLAPELDVEFWLDEQGRKGSHFSVHEQRGKWVYLKFWQNWCPGCHSHGFPALQKVSSHFADEPLVVCAGVQTVFEGHWFNTSFKVREMQLRYELQVPMGHDPGSHNPDGYPNTMRSYRTGGTPWQVLIEPGGRVVFNGFHVNADKVVEFLQQQVDLMKA